jgi:hypothetical protein
MGANRNERSDNPELPLIPRTRRVPEFPENAPEARLIVRYLTTLSFTH